MSEQTGTTVLDRPDTMPLDFTLDDETVPCEEQLAGCPNVAEWLCVLSACRHQVLFCDACREKLITRKKRNFTHNACGTRDQQLTWIRL